MNIGFIDMKEHLDRIKSGWDKVNNHRVFKTIRTGAERIIALFWLMIGSIGPYRLMRYMFGAVGAINLVTITQPNITSGLDIISHNLNTQYLIAFGMIAYAVLLEKNNIFMLTAGSIAAVYYAVMLAIGTAAGTIDIRGWMAVSYVTGFAAAVMVSSYSAFEHKRIKDELIEKVASMDTYQETNTRYQKRIKVLSELLIKNEIEIPDGV